jgi:hypothetical protein
MAPLVIRSISKRVQLGWGWGGCSPPHHTGCSTSGVSGAGHVQTYLLVFVVVGQPHIGALPCLCVCAECAQSETMPALRVSHVRNASRWILLIDLLMIDPINMASVSHQ